MMAKTELPEQIKLAIQSAAEELSPFGIVIDIEGAATENGVLSVPVILKQYATLALKESDSESGWEVERALKGMLWERFCDVYPGIESPVRLLDWSTGEKMPGETYMVTSSDPERHEFTAVNKEGKARTFAINEAGIEWVRG